MVDIGVSVTPNAKQECICDEWACKACLAPKPPTLNSCSHATHVENASIQSKMLKFTIAILTEKLPKGEIRISACQLQPQLKTEKNKEHNLFILKSATAGRLLI